MKKKCLFSVFFFLFLCAPCVFSAQDSAASQRDNILIVKERAREDLVKAVELKNKAETQIRNARAIMERAAANPNDPTLKNREQVLALAPGALKYGEEVLAKAQTAQREAELKISWSDRALKYLPDNGERKQVIAGGAFPLFSQWQGEAEVISRGQINPSSALEKTGIFPGDYISTKKDTVLKIATFFRPDQTLTIGPETEIGLQKDNLEETRWGLLKGKVHSASLYYADKTPPRIHTPKGVVEASPGSEFDVEVLEDGKTIITPYKGDVKLAAYKDDLLLGEELFTPAGDQAQEKPWWETTEKD